MMKKFVNHLDTYADNKEFLNIIEEFVNNATVQEMKNYRQHYETSCFDHCYMVAFYCYLICKKYHLDYISISRAAMVHDLFLYDWRVRQPNRKGLHAFTHAKLACENASQIFNLSQKEKDMIITHMWPVTLQFPTSIEGLILTFVDKYCATSETLAVLKSKMLMKKAFRYAYVFLSLLIIRV